MSSNPIVLAVVVTDLVVVVSFGSAVLRGLRIMLSWAEGQPSRGQLELERGAETMSLEARAAAILFLVSGAFFVIAVASALPATVPGAMCGTGVVQAMGATGQRALWLRGLALLLVAVWWVLDDLSRSSKRATLTLTTTRALLVAAPAVVLAAFESGHALFSLDVQTPVDCCTVVYETASAASAGRGGGVSSVPWIPLLLGGSTVVFALGVGLALLERVPSVWYVVLSLLVFLWIPIAWSGLVKELAAYHYGVLQHDCPWCLFAARHRLVGYVLFSAMGLVAYHGLSVLVAQRVLATASGLEAAARRRIRRSSGRVAFWLLVFSFLAVGPALLWRWRFGVWIDG